MAVSGLNKIMRGPDGKGSCFALASRVPLKRSELVSLLIRGLCLGGVWVFWVLGLGEWEGVWVEVCVGLVF